MRRSIALIAVVLAGCIDGTGPRPRPGAPDDNEPPPGGAVQIEWLELQPRVIVQGTTDTVVLNVMFTSAPTTAEVQLRTGQPVPLQRATGNTYTAKLPASAMLFGYRAGDLHQVAGEINTSSAAGAGNFPLVVNVKDNTVPLSSFTTVAPGVQSSDHVVNMRYDPVTAGNQVPTSLLRAFYGLFPDDYDFIAIVEAVQSPHRLFYTAVQQSALGIGLQRFDNSDSYGSSGRLEGIIQYPVDADFDLARTDNIHELAHRWMSFLTHPLLAAARPHWPISSLAIGIMGVAGDSAGAWSPFPFDLVAQPDGTYQLKAAADQPRRFNDLELYLMGMLAPDSVAPHIVFKDQNQRQQLRHNGVLQGGVDTLKIASIIAQAGTRNPSAMTSQRDFRIATIVLSRNGLLTRDELQFFDYMAARGELRTAAPYSNGVLRGTTEPFYVATDARGTLSARLRGAQLPL